jgi:hypothetical protein
MLLDKMVIILGEETPNKISLLEQLQENYNIYIPKRVTTDKKLATAPSLYSVSSISRVGELVEKDEVRSISYNNKDISFNISSKIGKGIADLFNGFIDGIVINADIKELGYYLKMYPSANAVGYFSQIEDANKFGSILPTYITDEEINNGIALSKISSLILKEDSDKLNIKK